jgi:hypothetical protein
MTLGLCEDRGAQSLPNRGGDPLKRGTTHLGSACGQAVEEFADDAVGIVEVG